MTSKAGISPAQVDQELLERKVKAMYRQVATEPDGAYHFELGRPLAERLGYPAELLDRIPAQALESFAGVGYFFDLATLSAGETVADLGSGSGADVFFAAVQVGRHGHVIGVDFTPEQLSKAARLAREHGFPQVELREGRIEELPIESASCDCVISNGVVNLAPHKERVFAEAARVLRDGGRLAFADIVSEQQLSDSITCDAELWASCIGGAAQVDSYAEAARAAGFAVRALRPNPYEFLSERARRASTRYGVKSVSMLAVKR